MLKTCKVCEKKSAFGITHKKCKEMRENHNVKIMCTRCGKVLFNGEKK